MNIINRYIIKNLLIATFMVALLVIGLDVCITFIIEQGDVGKGGYNNLNAFVFALLNSPSHLVAGFPVICLVGMVVGLSLLNNSNEIVIIRTNGYSLLKICSIAVVTAFCISLIVLAVSEWVAPWGKQTAEINKAVAKSGGQALRSKNGFWLRASGDFVHIEKILYDGQLEGITRYKVENDELTMIIHASKARFVQGVWYASDVKESIIKETGVTSSNKKEVVWEKFLKPEFLSVVSINPDDLSLSGLNNYIKYRKENKLHYRQYELAFWQKILQPLTVVVMVFLAIPFVFAEIRSTAVSKRLVLSIIIGVSYFLIEKFLESVVQFFDVPIMLGAVGPAICFVILAIWWAWQQKWRLV